MSKNTVSYNPNGDMHDHLKSGASLVVHISEPEDVKTVPMPDHARPTERPDVSEMDTVALEHYQGTPMNVVEEMGKRVAESFAALEEAERNGTANDEIRAAHAQLLHDQELTLFSNGLKHLNNIARIEQEQRDERALHLIDAMLLSEQTTHAPELQNKPAESRPLAPLTPAELAAPLPNMMPVVFMPAGTPSSSQNSQALTPQIIERMRGPQKA